MVRVTFWVPLLLLVLILKQSHEDSDPFNELESENLDLETYIKKIRKLKQQNENVYDECKVSIYTYIYINHSVWNDIY